MDMLENNLVSVVMPCRNGAETLAQAITSVLNQSYKNIELIYVDDGSVDGSIDIARNISQSDGRLKIIANDNSAGVSNARNLGIGFSCGRFICFLDADDFLLPGSISTRVNYLLNSGDKLTYGNYLRLMPNGDRRLVVTPRSITYRSMLRFNVIGNLTGMYDRSHFPHVTQSPVKHEDYLMWGMLVKKIGQVNSVGDDALGVYRVASTSLSGNKFKSAIWHWNILRNGFDLNLIASIYYQLIYIFASISNRVFGRKIK